MTGSGGPVSMFFSAVIVGSPGLRIVRSGTVIMPGPSVFSPSRVMIDCLTIEVAAALIGCDAHFHWRWELDIMD